MRLFIAVPFEKDYFLEIRENLPKVGMALATEFHITLSFLGEVEDVENIGKRLSVLEFSKFAATTSHIGMFSHVVWAGIEDNPLLHELQKNVFSLCPGKDD